MEGLSSFLELTRLTSMVETTSVLLVRIPSAVAGLPRGRAGAKRRRIV